MEDGINIHDDRLGNIKKDSVEMLQLLYDSVQRIEEKVNAMDTVIVINGGGKKKLFTRQEAMQEFYDRSKASAFIQGKKKQIAGAIIGLGAIAAAWKEILNLFK
jgi:hypothetical protein